MSLRASVFQHVRLGAEVTPGTVVSATQRLLNTQFNFNPEAPADPCRPVGSKYATDVTLQKEIARGTYEGALSFNDICYIFASVLKKPAAPSGSGAAKTWAFDSDAWNPDTIQTYTFDYGSSGRAERCGYGIFTGFEINTSRTAATIRGDVIGQKLTEGVTMASPTNVVSLPVWPKKCDILVGDSISGLAAVTNCIMASLNLRGRLGPAFFLRADTDSYDDVVELAPDFTAQLQVEHGSNAAGYMGDLRTAKQKFMRMKWTGVEIQTGINALLQITFPFKFQPPSRGEAEGLYASTFALVPDYEPTDLQKAIDVSVINSLGAL